MNKNLNNLKNLKNGPKCSIYKQILKENHKQKLIFKHGKIYINEPK